MSAAFAATCDSLARLSLPHTSITTAELVPPGKLSDAGLENLPAFCRVAATLSPVADSSIRIEVWMPVTGWNGRYLGTGNGGFAGRLVNRALASGLRGGYATASTDMGTAPPSGGNADALAGHPEKWTDWGWRATHEMTVAARQIIKAFYEQPIQYSYFQGCSTGGEQALMEAQRFPEDYDGISAGAPAHNRTRLHMQFIWDYAAGERDPESYIPAEKLNAVTKAAVAACKPFDAGLPTDDFLTTPLNCRWDPSALLCKADAGDSASCLTPKQVEAVRKLYAGPVNPRTHQPVYVGLPRGSEYGWRWNMPPPASAREPVFDSLFKWVFGTQWDWRTFDFDRDVTTVDAQLAQRVNATSTDLGRFNALGHKLLMYQGWSDWVVPPEESVNYYLGVMAENRSGADHSQRSALERTQSFYRLFMVPGMTHCNGGPGLTEFDRLAPVVRWVEQGVAPDALIASRTTNGTEMTRPLCPYPQVAHYKGSGDPNLAANFTCTDQPPAAGR